MIDPAKRTVQLGDRVGAALFTGTDKIRNGFGNGDCLLLDSAAGVFAVADAAERFPVASRILLERMATRVAEQERPLDHRSLARIVHELWTTQKYLEKTTLSCVALESVKGRSTVHIAHGGDSMVMLADTTGGGEVYFKTRPDMNFAGRGLTAPTVVSYPLQKRSDRIIIASDGLQDFNRVIDGNGARALSAFFLKRSFDQIMAALNAVAEDKKKGWEFDDLAMIIIDPFKPVSHPERPILIGGTSPAEERARLRSRAF